MITPTRTRHLLFYVLVSILLLACINHPRVASGACPDSLDRLTACCLNSTTCRVVYITNVEEGVQEHLSDVGSVYKRKVATYKVSNVMNVLMELACDNRCDEATSLLEIIEPCWHQQILSHSTMSCETVGESTSRFNTTSVIFYMVCFMIFVSIEAAFIILIWFKLRRRYIRSSL